MRRELGLVAALSLGCQGVLVGSSEDARSPERDAAMARDAGGRDAGGRDAAGPIDGGPAPFDASDPGFDAGGCAGVTFASALAITPLSGLGGGPYFAAPTDTDGAIVASTSGGARIQRVSGDGTVVGAPVTGAGNGLWGFDATADTWTAMVTRGDDALYLVGVQPSGVMRFEIRLLGEVDHSVTNNEWFGPLVRGGRVLWTGSQWAAYYTVQRLWPDGVAHYGDQLRFFDASGGDAGTAWDWGCSHSME